MAKFKKKTPFISRKFSHFTILNLHRWIKNLVLLRKIIITNLKLFCEFGGRQSLNLLNGLSRVTSCASSKYFRFGFKPKPEVLEAEPEVIKKNSTFILRNFSPFKIILNLGE